VAWNRAQHNDLSHEVSALQWAVTAMADAVDRLAGMRALDRPRAFTAIGDAVWWVTIVDATLVRHYPDSYDQVTADLPAAERSQVEAILAGLRFIRNRLGLDQDLAEFICTGSGLASDAGICTWSWRLVGPPRLDAFSARGQEWEMARYQAYSSQLAGCSICDSFARAAAFLEQVTAQAEVTGDVAEADSVT
jgi:hypothetical protein